MRGGLRALLCIVLLCKLCKGSRLVCCGNKSLKYEQASIRVQRVARILDFEKLRGKSRKIPQKRRRKFVSVGETS